MNRKPTAAAEADYVNSAVPAVNNSAECAVDKAAATPDQKFGSFTRSFSAVAGCWVILIAIMALRIHFTSVISENNSKLTAENQKLTNIVHKLNSAVNNLTVQFNNPNKSCTALESNNTDLTAENQELRTQNLELETQVKILTDTLEDMKTESNELNVSRVQWSIDQYCPGEGRVFSVRKCNSCQRGWDHYESSCYAISNAETADQKTWDEAQANCKGKHSELAVINNATEKEYIKHNSYAGSGINGYWIGLRVVDGKWAWVDGSNLTETSWIQPATATEGHCAISVPYNIPNNRLKSVSCSERNAWICEKKVLSLTPP